MITVDLLYIINPNRTSTMSCTLVDDTDPSKAQLLGPVDGRNAVIALAKLLHAALPEQFKDAAAAERHLVFTHFRNMAFHENSYGIAYPKKDVE